MRCAPPRLISMWSGPRNVSTAFMYSWRERSDTEVVDEPWYGHYLVHNEVPHPDTDIVISSAPTEFDSVIERLQSPSDRPVRFLKNMAHHLDGLDLSVLDLSDNYLLVRDPRDMLPSLMAGIGSIPTMNLTGLERQAEVFDQIAAAGSPPPVVLTSALLQDPRRILTDLCHELGIEFEPAALSWPAGPKPEDGIWASHWYKSVHQTTGFGRYEAKTGPIETELADLLERCQPIYDRLASNAL